MNMQTITAVGGQEFVLLPIECYKKLKPHIEKYFDEEDIIDGDDNDYVPFVLEHFVKNPVALERARAGLTQKQLAKLMGCAQSNISQMESVDNVTPDSILKVMKALSKYRESQDDQKMQP
jgi:DNA-binding XRE family transcriptional regulator